MLEYRSLIGNFARREIKGKYKGSLLGSTWSLLNPIATLLTYSIVFGFVLKFTPRVAGNGHLTSFPIFLFVGLVAWNFFNSIALGSMGALVAAGPLLKKIHFPPFAPVFGAALAALNQVAIEMGLLLAVLLIAMNIGWSFLLLPVVLIFWGAFSLGIGLFLASLNARYRDIGHIASVFFGLLFYTAPIIYPIETVRTHYAAHPWLQIYEWNPLTVFTEGFRNLLWDLTFPPLDKLAYMVVVGTGVLWAGWLFFQRRAADVGEDL